MSELLGAIGGGAVGLAVGEAGATVLEPALEAPKQEAWKASQARILELGELASLVAQALNAVEDVLDDANRNGYDEDQLRSAIQLALKAPGAPDAEKLYLRAQGNYPGQITLAQLQHAYAKAGLEGQWWDALTAAAQTQLLTPAELALSIVRSTVADPGLLVVTLDTSDSNVPQYPVAALNALDEAAAAGINPERLRVLVGDVGLPMASLEAAHAAFRGIITKGAYYQAILEGDTRPEWADPLYEVAREILTAHDYVELHLRGWIDQPTMYAGTALHGMSQADTDNLFLVLGRPIPVHQITKGLARGAVYDGDTSEIPAEYLKSMQEANTRPEWYALEFAANEYTWPGYFVLKPLTSSGVITVEECTSILEWSGWEPSLAAQTAQSFVTGTTTASTHVKSAQTAVVTAAKKAYLAGTLTPADATTHLEASGITPADTATILAQWNIIAAIEGVNIDTAGLTPT
jgi:hypothetical protein